MHLIVPELPGPVQVVVSAAEDADFPDYLSGFMF
jgi:hypothetical protein